MSNESFSKAKIISLAGTAAVGFGGLFILLAAFSWVISPGPVEVDVLLRTPGAALPTGRSLANPGQQRIQQQPRTAGWAFYNPITWTAERHDVTIIPAGKVGVLTAQDGDDMPPGQALAKVLER